MKRTLHVVIAIVLLSATCEHNSLANALASRESFANALSAALSCSAQLQSERAHVRQIAKEQLSVARSHWLPSISVSADRGIHHQSQVFGGLPFAVSASGKFRPTDLTASFDQPIYRGGRTVAETDEARAAISAEEARTTSVERSILERAAKAYIDVATEQELLRLRDEDVEDLRKTLAQVRLQYEAGGVTRTDILQAQVRLYSSIVERRAEDEKLDAAGVEFERTIGHPPSSLQRPEHFIDLPDNLQSAMEIAARLNPDLKIAEYDRIKAARKIRDVEGELLPTIDLEIGYQCQINPNLVSHLVLTPSRINNVYALLSVSLNLFQADVYARAAGARYGLRSAASEEEDVSLTVRAKVGSAWASLISARDRNLELGTVVETSRSVLDGVRAEQLAGTRTVLEVLNAQRDFRDAEISQLQATRDQAVAEVELAAAIGIFSRKGLAFERLH